MWDKYERNSIQIELIFTEILIQFYTKTHKENLQIQRVAVLKIHTRYAHDNMSYMIQTISVALHDTTMIIISSAYIFIIGQILSNH